MKQLTTEEKAKAYDEALERAKLYKGHDVKSALEFVFPELKESEDERIRKAIGYAIGQSTHSDGTLINGVSSEEALTWIEKQGEHVNFINKIQIGDKVTRNEDGVLVNLSQLKRVAKKNEKQSEQEVSVVDFKAKDWYVSKVDGKIYNAKFMEKTPTNQARKLEIEKAAMSATGIIEQEEWFIKGAEWSDKNPSYISLEKQGEQKPAFEMITPEESLGIDSETYNKIVDECIYGEQKSAEEYNITGIGSKHAEGKLGKMIKKKLEMEKQGEQKTIFKVKKGEWYVCTNTFVSSRGKIIAIKGQTYQSQQEDDTITCEDNCLFIDRHDGKASEYFRLWTIEEARDGDVLHSTGFHNDCIFIFNGLDNWKFDEPNGDRAVATGYCCLFVSADNMEFGVQGPDCVEVNTIKPATKEQCDLLFQKMKEAGYEFDFEKRELMKIENEIEIPFGAKDSELQEATYYIPKGFHAEIEGNNVIIKKGEQKPAWSEEDESMLTRCIGILGKCYMGELPTKVEEELNWLKYLSDRVQLQPKQEWSKDDEDTIKFLISHFCVSHCSRSFQFTTNKLITHDELLEKIRNLRPHWKPSDEQMDALEWQLGNTYEGSWQYKATKELYEQLKKLREE